MKYQIEYCPNQDVVIIHVGQRLIRGTIAVYEHFDLDEDAEKDFRKDARRADQLISFCEAVNELDGMEEQISFSRYKIQLEKALAFSWESLLPHILEALRTFVAEDNKLEELAPATHPTPELLETLRNEGCDV